MTKDLVFATGGSGHLGFRVLINALEAGYQVRASVRRESAIKAIKATASIQPYLDRLEFVIVPDIVAEGAYDNVLDGVTYVIHVASPIAFPTDDYERDLIKPAVAGTTNILKAAANHPSIKRVVITSSIVGVISWNDFFAEEKPTVFTDKDATAEPTGPYSNGFEAYGASKVKSLHATNNFMEANKPTFDVINVLPGFLIGKNELITSPADIPNGTNAAAFAAVLGNKAGHANPGASAHVDDAAKVHVLALDPKVAGSQNFMVVSGGLEGTQYEDSVAIVAKHYPEEVKKGIFPLGGTAPSKRLRLDASRTEEVLGIKFRPYEDQVLSIAEHYLELVSKA